MASVSIWSARRKERHIRFSQVQQLRAEYAQQLLDNKVLHGSTILVKDETEGAGGHPGFIRLDRVVCTLVHTVPVGHGRTREYKTLAGRHKPFILPREDGTRQVVVGGNPDYAFGVPRNIGRLPEFLEPVLLECSGTATLTALRGGQLKVVRIGRTIDLCVGTIDTERDGKVPGVQYRIDVEQVEAGNIELLVADGQYVEEGDVLATSTDAGTYARMVRGNSGSVDMRRRPLEVLPLGGPDRARQERNFEAAAVALEAVIALQGKDFQMAPPLVQWMNQVEFEAMAAEALLTPTARACVVADVGSGAYHAASSNKEISSQVPQYWRDSVESLFESIPEAVVGGFVRDWYETRSLRIAGEIALPQLLVPPLRRDYTCTMVDVRNGVETSSPFVTCFNVAVLEHTITNETIQWNFFPLDGRLERPTEGATKRRERVAR